MNIYGVSICVINTHLTPHDHLLADRISEYNTIMTDHTFTVPYTSRILYHEYEYLYRINLYHSSKILITFSVMY